MLPRATLLGIAYSRVTAVLFAQHSQTILILRTQTLHTEVTLFSLSTALGPVCFQL